MATVRLATTDDIAAIARVHVESWQSAYRELLPAAYLSGLALSEREEQWRQVLAGRNTTVLVAVDQHDVVGFVAFGPVQTQAVSAEYYKLFALYLLEHYWSTGVGRQLLQAGLQQMREQGAQVIRLAVLSANERARKAYEAVQFTPVVASEETVELGGIRLQEMQYQWTLTDSLR